MLSYNILYLYEIYVKGGLKNHDYYDIGKSLNTHFNHAFTRITVTRVLLKAVTRNLRRA